MTVRFLLLFCALLAIKSIGSQPHSSALPHNSDGIYGIGTGIADITGPIAEVGMMGYASVTQRTHGLHTRLRSRAFVLFDPHTQRHVALVVADLGMIFSSVKEGVLAYVQREIPHRYTHENLMLSATHTHSGPGGFSFYPLYNITTLGFNQQNYEAIVNGIGESIVHAHRSIMMGRISYGTTDLAITHNRSHAAYANNAPDQINALRTSTNPTMHLLKFQNLDGKPIGVINWFAVHPVSLSLNNRLVSSDNRGMAAYLFEKRMGVTYRQSNEFVAAFAQADEGDVSPYDIAHPPITTQQEFSELEQSAEAQANAAWKLFEQNLQPLSGPIDVRHQFISMPNFLVRNEFTGEGDHYLCSAALGESFAAGTENGRPSIALVDEGRTAREPQSTCHREKPILIDNSITTMMPNVMPFQIMRIGSLLILGVPGEMTTIAGQIVRAAVAQQFNGPIIINGLSNEYGHYIATRREYAAQHYEGASTLYGPWTNAAYAQIFSDLARAVARAYTVPAGIAPPDMSHLAVRFVPGVIFDAKPWGKKFGEVHHDVKSSYVPGDVVTVTFVGAHPNNDLRRNGSYLRIERFNKNKFEPLFFDWDHNTTLEWTRVLVAQSRITITWKTNATDLNGRYRICHTGTAKNFFGELMNYDGCSSEFHLVNAPHHPSKSLRT